VCGGATVPPQLPLPPKPGGVPSNIASSGIQSSMGEPDFAAVMIPMGTVGCDRSRSRAVNQQTAEGYLVPNADTLSRLEIVSGADAAHMYDALEGMSVSDEFCDGRSARFSMRRSG
jgi:hypothetical protein